MDVSRDDVTPQQPDLSVSRELARHLGLADLSLLTVGVIIGSGIFLVPSGVFRESGDRIDVTLVLWLFGGVLSFVGALTYGELAAMKPAAGGLYVYIRDSMGRLPAFLYGWALFFVICSGSIATLAVAFAMYLGELFPLSEVMRSATSIGMIAVVAAINIRGTRHSANVQNGTTMLKVAALMGMSAVCIWGGSQWAAGMTGVRPGSPDMSRIGVALIGVLWAYEGWQYVTFSAGEVVNPQRTFPRAIALGTGMTVGIYLVANVAYFAALGPALGSSTRIASEALSHVAGPWAAKAIAAAILISIFSGANALMLTAPRVYFAMAKDGLFFARLARVHPAYGTPAVAIGASSVWAMLLAATGTFERLLTYVVFAGWAFYALAAASIFWYRRMEPDAPRPFRVPGYPVTPLAFVLAALGVVISTLVQRPSQALVGIGLVALGVPAFLFWRRLHGPHPPAPTTVSAAPHRAPRR